MDSRIEVLMIEDNRGDVVLVREAMATVGLNHRLTVVPDGVEAMRYLNRDGEHAGATRPALIILDLNLPRKSGLDVLDEIQLDPSLRDIPVFLLSSSLSELDKARSRGLPPQGQKPKPSTFAGYIEMVMAIEAYRQAAAGGAKGGSS